MYACFQYPEWIVCKPCPAVREILQGGFWIAFTLLVKQRLINFKGAHRFQNQSTVLFILLSLSLPVCYVCRFYSWILMHGRHVRFFGQIVDQVFWPEFLGQKMQCTVLPGPRNTVYSTTGTGKYSFTVPPGWRTMGEKTMH